MNTRSSSSIRRQLFMEEQPVGRSGEHRSDEESEKLLDQKQAEWNFDFRNGRPLPGRYEWIQVEQTSPGEALLRPVTSTTITNQSNATDTAGVQIQPTRRHSRASVSQRSVPYDLRSRSRGIRNNELRSSSLEHYRSRERPDNSSSVITSNRSNERLQSDVRT